MPARMNTGSERMMGLVDDAMADDVAHWKAERQLWQGALEWLKSGRMKPGERVPGGGLIDTTADRIEYAERYTQTV
jgi:hypothetical protein